MGGEKGLTENNPLRTSVIRGCDGAEAFLACCILLRAGYFILEPGFNVQRWYDVTDETQKRTHMLSFTFFPFTSILCTYKMHHQYRVHHHHHIYSAPPPRSIPCTQNEQNEKPTRKSTPIVALLSSSGSHCSSEKRRSKLLFPTEEFPINSSLQLIGGAEGVGLSVGAIVCEEWARRRVRCRVNYKGGSKVIRVDNSTVWLS